MATSKAEIEEMKKDLERKVIRVNQRVRNIKAIDVTNVKLSLSAAPPSMNVACPSGTVKL